ANASPSSGPNDSSAFASTAMANAPWPSEPVTRTSTFAGPLNPSKETSDSGWASQWVIAEKWELLISTCRSSGGIAPPEPASPSQARAHALALLPSFHWTLLLGLASSCQSSIESIVRPSFRIMKGEVVGKRLTTQVQGRRAHTEAG